MGDGRANDASHLSFLLRRPLMPPRACSGIDIMTHANDGRRLYDGSARSGG